MGMDHEIMVKINDFVKFSRKTIRVGQRFPLKVTIGLDNLDLDNTLTILDKTESDKKLPFFVYSVEMSIVGISKEKKKRKRKNKESDEENESDSEVQHVDKNRPNDTFHNNLEKNKMFTADDFLLWVFEAGLRLILQFSTSFH